MSVLDKRGVPGAIIIGILAVSIIAWVFGIADPNGVVGSYPLGFKVLLVQTLVQLLQQDLLEQHLLSYLLTF